MTIINRYTATIPGELLMTGNTLGLAKQLDSLNPGTANGIVGIITTDTTVPTAAGWGAIANLPNNENVTFDWQDSSSSAFLTIPPGSTVEYAELIWSALFESPRGPIDISAFINNTITLVDPSLAEFTITPDPITAQELDLGQSYYCRSANVTNIINNGGSGEYTVSGVPIGISALENNSVAGWILILAYSNPSLQNKNLNIYTALEGIVGANPPVDLNISGFLTPPIGTPDARLILSAGEGDPNATGDTVELGPTVASLVTLSGPNNLANNFFASQINNNLGQLDTTGTFGNRNSVPPNVGFAARHGWDVTNIDSSAAFVNDQTDAVLRISTGGEGYFLTGIGIQIEAIDEPLFIDLTKNGPEFVYLGDTLTYTITGTNTGTTAANDTVFTDTLPDGLTFVPDSVFVNGMNMPGEDPEAGIDLGTIPRNGSFTVSFQATATTVPTPNPVVNEAVLNYTFIPIAGASPENGESRSNQLTTQINQASSTLVKSSDKSEAQIGEVITYTTLVTNNGNVTLNNVIFTDTPPVGTVFIPGSVEIDGVNDPNANPSTGINLGSIMPGDDIEVSFMVRVIQIVDTEIINISNIDFEYERTPGGQVDMGSNQSNPVTVLTNRLEVTICSKQYSYKC